MRDGNTMDGCTFIVEHMMGVLSIREAGGRGCRWEQPGFHYLRLGYSLG